MLVGYTALIISILFVQVKALQQNGNTNSPNLVLNRTFTFNSQGNGMRSKLNTVTNNQLNTLQQSDNMNLAKSLQQALNLQQANFNTQNVNSQNVNQQFQNLQQLQSIPGSQSGNFQQTLLLQQPVNSQQLTNSIYPSNLPQTVNIQPQSQNVQILSQLSDVSNIPNSQFSQTYAITNPASSNPSELTSVGTNPTFSYPTVVTNPMSSNPSVLSSMGTNSISSNHQSVGFSLGTIPAPSNPSVASSIGVSPMSSNPSVISTIGTNPSTVSSIGTNPVSSNPSVASISPNQVNQPLTQQVLQYPNVSPGDVVSLVYTQNQQGSNSGTTPTEMISVVGPPQNQQVSYSGPSPYVVDLSQVTNNIPTTMTSPTFTTLSNQPSLVTILAPQQQHQPHTVQSSIVTNPANLTNQFKVVKTKPASPTHCKGNHDQNHINVVCPHGPQTTSSPFGSDTASTINSLLTSTLTKQASKSSNLKALLPLIFNLIKERNNCGCHHHHHCEHQCDCPNNKLNKCEGGGEINDSYSKQKRYGYNQNYKSDFNSKYANEEYEEYDDRDSYESPRNSKRYDQRKRTKPVSEEYYYSDELQDY